MKLATYQDGSRDGQLVVVSRDLGLAHYASGVATRLQQVLDDWNFLSPQLEELSQTLNHGKARHAFAFEPGKCMAPLPRAYQRATAAAGLRPAEVARGAELPDIADTGPLLAQRASDDLRGPHDPIVAGSPEHGIDCGAEIAVVTGDVAMGTAPEAAIDAIRLVMLANDVSLRAWMPTELAHGFGFVQSRPATAFGPVAVTPDELLHAWRGGRVHLDVETQRNGKRVGLCDAGGAMGWHFGQLIAHLCTTRPVRAGSVIGSGPLGSADASRGPARIADQRAFETLERGAPTTAYLQFGDTVRIEVKGPDGASVFGAIAQTVVAAEAA